ncbi:MAG: hypothetical protein JSR33_04265, partial [Proteobacteria bacterium]|nr:hypothetical protein [Pseudomonadota bacterium]
PEPEWLNQITSAYENEEIAGVGGFVFDHTGYDLQYHYCLADRLGDADVRLTEPTSHFSFPYSFRYPHFLGTNATFRRSVLVKINGFDEEYEYHLDETDVCLRIIDAGYVLKQIDQAYVHHRYAPSHVRTHNKVITYHYPFIKNRIYFYLKHAQAYCSQEDWLHIQEAYINHFRNGVRAAINSNQLNEQALEKFEIDIAKAITDGYKRGHEGVTAQLTPDKIAKNAGPFKTFPTKNPCDFLTIVFIFREYAQQEASSKILNFIKNISAELAHSGHIVHIITQSQDINRVDWIDGVWVHHILNDSNFDLPIKPQKIPKDLWQWSANALQEVNRIATHRQINIIEAPIKDVEGIAVGFCGKWPLITNLIDIEPKSISEIQQVLMGKSAWIRKTSQDPLLPDQFAIENWNKNKD